jgi:hypothetical protein
MVLLLVELLLSIPISNAKVERMFSLMNRVKTDFRASLTENTLNNLIRIRMESHSGKVPGYAKTSARKQQNRKLQVGHSFSFSAEILMYCTVAKN